jgi:hypothetical protein
MKASDQPTLRAGDSIVYLLDRTHVTEADIADMGNAVLTQMANEWLKAYPARFFTTVARNYQPIVGSKLNTFDSHDDSVLFHDRPALVAALSTLARSTGGCRWIIVAPPDVQDLMRSAITAFKPN